MIKGRVLVSEWSEFLKTGDATAFYVLYDHYHDYLNYIGLQKGATTQKVKDQINDLFLYVFENREKLNHVKNHHNYLVSSFVRSLFRKEHFSTAESLELNDESLPEMHSYPSAETIFIQQNAREEITALVKDYVEMLSGSQSKMIYQKFYLGLSYPEIAEANNITVKTAYNTVLQAVAKLKKLIPPEHAGALAAAITLLSGLFWLFLFR
jgi:RNA polymerase sigma factor (sigma-70 family)